MLKKITMDDFRMKVITVNRHLQPYFQLKEPIAGYHATIEFTNISTILKTYKEGSSVYKDSVTILLKDHRPKEFALEGVFRKLNEWFQSYNNE